MSHKIVGINSVYELLCASDSSNIIEVNIDKKSSPNKIKRIIKLCNKKKIKYVFTDLKNIQKIAGTRKHQGVLAYVNNFKYTNLEETFNSKQLLILDSIQDPHNLGAIIRTAAAAGMGGVIIPKNGSASINETVIEVSCGTIYKVPIIMVTNIVQTMQTLKKQGFWTVGTSGKATISYRDYQYSEKIAIVIGNEGNGLRRLIEATCDDLINIPMYNNVESLNASVAAALIMYESTRDSYK